MRPGQPRRAARKCTQAHLAQQGSGIPQHLGAGRGNPADDAAESVVAQVQQAQSGRALRLGGARDERDRNCGKGAVDGSIAASELPVPNAVGVAWTVESRATIMMDGADAVACPPM